MALSRCLTQLTVPIGRPVLVLGLLWQIIRLQLMGLIHVKNIPELDVLRHEGEDKAAFIKLSPEVILIRWLNYHLRKAGSTREANNFSSDLAVTHRCLSLY